MSSLYFRRLRGIIQASAQPDLRIESVEYKNGRCEIQFNLYCGISKVYDLRESDFTISENGLTISDFSLICADTSQHCCKSVGVLTSHRPIADFIGQYKGERAVMSFFEK